LSLAHDFDVRGLLQLATLVIYGNKVSLNGFEGKGIAKRSLEIVEQLRTLGITEDILAISPVTEAEYALACMTAANSIAAELCDSFNPEEHRLIGGEPPELPRGLQERQVKYITIAREPKGSVKLRKIKSGALKDKATGAVEYMLACSHALREAVSRAVSLHPNWREMHSYQLNVFLRYHLNEALAEQSFSKYTPAVARAELIQRRSQYLIEALQDVVDETVEELRGKPLGVPSTLAALLQRSRGEPQAILKVAREMREHSGALRDSLEVLATKHPNDTPESRFEIRSVITELGRQLKRDVGLEKATKLRDVVELKFVMGVPALSVSCTKLVDWIQERRKSKRTAVLTELVKASAYSDFSPNLYEKLCSFSTKKSR
jgi:hypothetical protein